MDTDLAARRRAVRQQILDCTNCNLRVRCEAPVPFVGPSDATLTIVGEAPGRYEDKAGKPFVGPSGKYLRRTLEEKTGLTAEDLFFLNTVSCRPSHNSDPPPTAIEACSQNFTDQLSLTTSRFILLAGKFAFKVFRPHDSLARWHGFTFWREGRILFPVHHPARAMRDPLDGDIRAEFEADIERLGGLIEAPSMVSLMWPNRCMADGCNKDVEIYDAEGVPWCKAHRIRGTDHNMRLFEIPQDELVPKRKKAKYERLS